MKTGLLGWGYTRALFVCVLAIVPYARALEYPFISDDYIQIRLAREYGSPQHWRELADDPLYRCRATSLYLTAATEKLFGLHPVPYNVTSVLLHAVNVLLVWALIAALGFDPRAALTAAGFYAVYEGHQEAVIWYAALPEQLVVGFCLASVLCWVRWYRGRGAVWYGLALLLFVLALFSKESSVAVAPLLGLAAFRLRTRPWKRTLASIVPFAVLAAVYAAFIFMARGHHMFFFDGTFTPSPRFLFVLPHSFGRMMFFWGALAALVLGRGATLAFSLGWMAITLLPYSFLSYMSRVPSRHTYFAAVGLSLLVGAAFVKLHDAAQQRRRWLAPVLALLIVAHNCIYLWTKKHYQYMVRAAPTEELLAHIRSHKQYRGPTWVVDFPYDKDIVLSAVAVATTRDPRLFHVVDDPPAAPGAHMLVWDDTANRLIVR